MKPSACDTNLFHDFDVDLSLLYNTVTTSLHKIISVSYKFTFLTLHNMSTVHYKDRLIELINPL